MAKAATTTTASRKTATSSRKGSRKGNSKGKASAPTASQPEATEAAGEGTEATEAAGEGTDAAGEDDRKAKWKAFRSKSKHIQFAIRTNNIRNRVSEYGSSVASWECEDLVTAYSTAVEALDHIVDVLEAMPEDFVPPRAARRTKAKAKVEAGSHVDIREKFRSRYEGILEDVDMTNLEVTLVASGCVKVVTNSDEAKIVLPRGQVMIHRPPTDDADNNDTD